MDPRTRPITSGMDHASTRLRLFDISRFDSSKIQVGAQAQMVGWFLDAILGLPANTELADEEAIEIKFRHLCNALVAANLLAVTERPQWREALKSFLESPSLDVQFPVRTLNEGISLMKIEDCISLSLPTPHSPFAAEHCITVLDQLYDEECGVRHWVLDFSNIDQLSPALVAYLLGLNQTMNKGGHHLMLLWLRRDALPEMLLSPINRHFHCVKKGAFLLSRSAGYHTAG